MKHTLLILTTALFWVPGAASADPATQEQLDQIVSNCEATLSADGMDTAICACIAEQAADDAEQAEQLIVLNGIERHENRMAAAGEKALDAIQACLPGE